MISFNPTALTQPTLLIQRKTKARRIFPRKTFQNFTQLSFTVSIFNKNSRFASNLFSSNTALKHFRKKAMADMTTTFLIQEDDEPMATEPIYLSSDESDYSTRDTTPDHQLEFTYSDAINQLIASQLDQRSNTGTETAFYPPTPNMSMKSDDQDSIDPTPIIGKPEQYTPQIPPRPITKYNFANMCNLSQTRRNLRLQKIVDIQTILVPVIFLTHRRQSY